MKLVPLTKGKFAWVDDADYASVASFNWHEGAKAYNEAALTHFGEFAALNVI